MKGDGGAVGLTENPAALKRWMLAGPDIARVTMKTSRTNERDSKCLLQGCEGLGAGYGRNGKSFHGIKC